MKIILDFLPLLFFFGAYRLHAEFGISKEEAIYFATPVLMGATAVQMSIIYLIDRKLSTMHKITLGMVLVFGGITLALHDKRFIMWKPTVMYAGMAIALAVSAWLMQRNIVRTLLGSQIDLPDPVWHRLNLAWIAYCLFMAASNAYVAQYYSEEAWASFKVWGYVFPLAFILGQGVYIALHMRKDEQSTLGGVE